MFVLDSNSAFARPFSQGKQGCSPLRCRVGCYGSLPPLTYVSQAGVRFFSKMIAACLSRARQSDLPSSHSSSFCFCFLFFVFCVELEEMEFHAGDKIFKIAFKLLSKSPLILFCTGRAHRKAAFSGSGYCPSWWDVHSIEAGLWGSWLQCGSSALLRSFSSMLLPCRCMLRFDHKLRRWSHSSCSNRLL